MTDSPVDRRQRRSMDPLVALHYQLSHARAEDELVAIVVADSSGVVVAGAGAWPVCEELAAYAPFFAQKDGDLGDVVSSRVAALRKEVTVHTMSIDGADVLVCARGGRKRGEIVTRAAAGVGRILRAA